MSDQISSEQRFTRERPCPQSASVSGLTSPRFTVETAVEFGRRGGVSTSPAKRRTAALNGRRGGRPVLAHQYRMRRAERLLDPRRPVPALDDCKVEPISYAEAASIILRYEYLRTMAPNTLACYGLLGPDGEVLGATCFACTSRIPTVPTASEVCLARGACVPWAPPNAASYLIRRATQQAHQDHGWESFVAYGDPDAGEVGTIYQACNWLYLGRCGRHGLTRSEWKRPGTMRWISDRNLSHQGFTGPGAWARARASGWMSRVRPSKHRYVWLEGPRVKALRALIADRIEPYPTRGRA